MIEIIAALGSIILVDLVLSGDNALVIGAAAAGLPKKERFIAIICGGGSAIVLRIIFTVAAALLLQVPYLSTIGGVILLYIAIRLLLDRSKESRKTEAEKLAEAKEASSKGSRGFWPALFTILVADVTMSLDNVLAVSAVAHNNLVLLVIGLLLSIAVLLIGSSIVASLINRAPWLLDVACLVLAWTASHIILGDHSLKGFVESNSWTTIVFPVIAFVIVGAADIILRVQDHKILKERIA